MKRLRDSNMYSSPFTSNDVSVSNQVRQRTAGWGPYAAMGPTVNMGAVIRLPPTESSFITELGGKGADEGLGSVSMGNIFQNNVGLGGCQRIIEDGMFDCNGYYTFTEENNFVQLILYDFYNREEDNVYLQPRTCFIDLGGALKYSISKRGEAGGEGVQMSRLIDELIYTINASFGISWPRFCWWNNEILAPLNAFKKSCENEYYTPQSNPVDLNMGTVTAAMFQQRDDAIPMILCQKIGVNQLCFSINPAFQEAHPGHDFYLQLCTPRLSPIFTRGTYPAMKYLNPNLINGKNGWFRKGYFVFGFGYRDKFADEYFDIYQTESMMNSQIGDTALSTIADDFVTTTTASFGSEETYAQVVNALCTTRLLQKVVIANLPCTLTNSRYYAINSPELSTNQIMPFISSKDCGGTTESTTGIIWNTVINGNRPRDITGKLGERFISKTCKEINPMFNLTNYTLTISTELGGLIESNQSQTIIEGEDAKTKLIKDSTLFFSNRIPITYEIKDISGNTIDPQIISFPDCYDSLAPDWMISTNGNYDTQFDIEKVCRNRLLIRYDTVDWGEETPSPDVAPNINYGNYKKINDLWNSSLLTYGLEKTSEKSVHFMRAVGF